MSRYAIIDIWWHNGQKTSYSFHYLGRRTVNILKCICLSLSLSLSLQSHSRVLLIIMIHIYLLLFWLRVVALLCAELHNRNYFFYLIINVEGSKCECIGSDVWMWVWRNLTPLRSSSCSSEWPEVASWLASWWLVVRESKQARTGQQLTRALPSTSSTFSSQEGRGSEPGKTDWAQRPLRMSPAVTGCSARPVVGTN